MAFYTGRYGSTAKITDVMIVVLLVSSTIVTSYSNADVHKPTAAIKLHQIVITGFEFVPKNFHVSPGDTVVWVNHDIVPHSIIISATKKVISPGLDTGERFKFVVKSDTSYECGFHPTMQGKLTTN